MSFSADIDATAIYEHWEDTVSSWQELQQRIDSLTSWYPDVRMVWRGQAGAHWGLMSSLYRVVGKELQRAPEERDLVEAEKRLLQLARSEWRLDGIPALQLFARMQHVGVPTRLIDVSFNPLVATWFAVAKMDGVDARLFAFASSGRLVQLNSLWNSNRPRWHTERLTNWGTGLGRRVWQPPALHNRIPAQSAAFLLDGVPVAAPEHGYGRQMPEGRTWQPDYLRRYASIPLNLRAFREGSLPVQKGPVFVFRITAEAKAEIRDRLERVFGYRFATIYADIEGLAEYVRDDPKRLMDKNE